LCVGVLVPSLKT